MNCAAIHDRLPLLIYEDLQGEEKAAVETHLATCPDCRREYAALQNVPRLLDQAPAPAPHVDLARLYQEAAERQTRRVRRWRRAALGLSGAAALLAVAVLGFRLEVRWEAHQLLVRWGSPPVAENTLPTPPAPVVTPPTEAKALPEGVTPQQFQRVTNLVHAVADLLQDLEQRQYALEQRQHKEAKQIQQDLDRLRKETAQNWLAFERSVNALYLMTKKGE
jgi:anti-sigma factor RsiW